MSRRNAAMQELTGMSRRSISLSLEVEVVPDVGLQAVEPDGGGPD
jgi:hypothetical protein